MTQSEKNLENVECIWEMEINGIKERADRLSEKSLIYLGKNNFKLLDKVNANWSNLLGLQIGVGNYTEKGD